MLKRRRLLEMGTRIHWYLLFSTMGLFLFYVLCLNFDVSTEFCNSLDSFLRKIIMLSLVFGIWIFIFCLSTYFRDKIFPLKSFVGNVVRMIFVIIVDIGFSVISEIAGKSFLIF